MRVCIIGAGIIGCSTAYALARAGHEVVLLDEAALPAQAASFANGAQLSYSYVQPLASPATFLGLPSMLMSSRSPLVFQPRLDWRQWAWGVRFLAACTPGQSRRGTRVLWELAQRSRATLDEWRAGEDWEFSFARNGKLVLCPDAATLASQRDQVTYQARLGAQQSVLSAAECVAREPSLAASRLPFAGGVWTEDECVADAAQLAEAMVNSLRRSGGQFRSRTKVTGWRTQGDRVTAACVTTGGGEEEVEADAFVVAAGVAASGLVRGLGGSLPIYPIKGYSLTLKLQPGAVPPRASITDLGIKTVFAPLAGHLRVAAMVEIGGYETTVEPERIRRMTEHVESMFPGLTDPAADAKPWAGLRPATPDSLPIIGPSRRWSNLWLNVGHGALGLTLAAGSADQIATELTHGRSG